MGNRDGSPPSLSSSTKPPKPSPAVKTKKGKRDGLVAKKVAQKKVSDAHNLDLREYSVPHYHKVEIL